MPTVLQAFTDFHTAISLVALIYGLPVMAQLIRTPGNFTGSTLRLFVWLAFLSTFTGFFFPFNGFTPAIGTGIVTSVIFAGMYLAWKKGARGWWGFAFTVGLIAQEFFLFFVTIVQSFLKIPSLHVLAPTQTEPAFTNLQIANLGIFALIALLAVVRRRSIKPRPLRGKQLRAA